MEVLQDLKLKMLKNLRKNNFKKTKKYNFLFLY